jgi:hypothetical protein
MPPILPYTGIIKNGQFYLDRSKHFTAEAVAVLGDGPVQMVLSRMHPARSSASNRYYWGIMLSHILMALQELGNDVDPSDEKHRKWLHRILKEHYLGLGKYVSQRGRTRYVQVTTAGMPEDQWRLYVDRIRIDVAEIMQYDIPAPPTQE